MPEIEIRKFKESGKFYTSEMIEVEATDGKRRLQRPYGAGNGYLR